MQLSDLIYVQVQSSPFAVLKLSTDMYVNCLAKGSIAPICTKITYDLTIAIINKCFEFQNDWLKIIPVRYNCTQFCPIPLC